MAIILDGKMLSSKIKAELKLEVDTLKKSNITPGLAVVIVGDDEASKTYVKNKKIACEEVGMRSFEYALNAETTQEELMALVYDLNKNPAVSGILVQLPLPAHLNEKQVIYAIDPMKDVDAFHPFNVGRIMIGNPDFQPCTPAGIMELIKESGIAVEGKECVVVGRSNLVGKPLSILLLAANGTVTMCHSKTKNLSEVCRRADILVVAIGKEKFIKGDAIKPGAVVIDVGMNRMANGKLTGDVDFDSAEKSAYAITPVPGGVGPMTIAMLMKSTIKAAKIQNGIGV